ncbi:MAG: hypothetical protein LLG04_13680 [Parachlamydia sp.]|nr:hypothetical protein [Parachlamydia sp.]
MHKLAVLILLIFSGICQPLLGQQQIVRRAALDIGSGKVKIQVADVDLAANKITQVIFSDNAVVRLREDLNSSLEGRLSLGIQENLFEVISELMKKAAAHQPEAFHGIATEPLRLAKNRDEVLLRIKQETGLSVTVVSQEQEGVIGLITAASQAGVDLDQAVSWDIGGGSFQLATKCGNRFIVFQECLGSVPMKQAVLKIQGKNPEHHFSPNPISQRDMERSLQFLKTHLHEVPPELYLKLMQPDVVVLGIGIHPLWSFSVDYEKLQVLRELYRRLNLTDKQLGAKDGWSQKEAYLVSNLILTYGVMDHAGIQSVQYVGTAAGNAIGVLLSPQYWKN